MRDATSFSVQFEGGILVLRLHSEDGTNRLTQTGVGLLTEAIEPLAHERRPLVIAGNANFFSAGADLHEIAQLDGVQAYDFARAGQKLMNSIEHFPAPVYAAISGYCMGGGLDLALACHVRIAAPNAIFGHRGSALGLITGWGGTQRLPRVIGKANALHMFVAAEKIAAADSLRIGLIDTIADDPVNETMRRIAAGQHIFS
jgi:enoyl-CoA hydratase/carnithine racemase